MAESSKIYLELLGCPQIFLNGSVIHVNRKRVRALLFYLVAENNPISRSHLSYMLWPDKDYSTASQNLSIYLSYLKNEFDDDIIVVTSDRISLSPAVSSDIGAYHALISSGRADAAVEALKLFRGSFLDGFSLQQAHTFDQWVIETASYWHNKFIETSMAAAEHLAQNNNWEEALSCLEKARKSDPLNEGLCRQIMTLLGAIGNRSSITKVYHELVSILGQELGIPPSPETSACYKRIISLDEYETTPEKQDSQSTPMKQGILFVGRQALLKSFSQERKGRFILIQGKSGLGKTSLVNAYIQSSKLFDITIAFKQQDRDIPYYAIIKLIRNYTLSDSNTEELRNISRQIHPDRWSVLCQLVPELNHISEANSSPSVISPQQIMESFEQFFFCMIRKRPTVLFVDDIHYSDLSSLNTLLQLITQPLLDKVQFFATFRPSLSHPDIVSFLNTLQRESYLQTIELGKLDNESMLQLLTHYCPDIASDIAQKLLLLADGNPFWMKTIIQGLDSGYTEIAGKNSLTNLFNYSIRSLSPKAANVLYAMAIHGESCDASLFTGFCSVEAPNESERIFMELSNASLVSRDSTGTVKFSHSKIYEYVLSITEINPAQVRAIHLVIARIMETVYGERASGQQIISIADHFKLSDQPELCAKYASKAGGFLLSIANPQQAGTYYKLAYSYLGLPDKLDTVLSMYSNMLQLGQNYEANLYINNSIAAAESSGYREYALVFEALLMLSEYPEYLELQLGIGPCYKLPADKRIADMLLESKALIEAGKPNPFLMNHLLSLLSAYYRIIGDFPAAQNYLNQIIGQNITRPENDDITSRILLYSAVRDMIVLLNQMPDRKTFEVLLLEEQVFKSAPIQSFMCSNFGSKALLMNLQGNTEEGARLMNSAISAARRYGSKITLADSLTTNALLIRKTNLEQSYSMNFEAYTISKEANLKYTMVRALTGLVVTSSSVKAAKGFYQELQHIADQIGNDSINPKLETARRALQKST